VDERQTTSLGMRIPTDIKRRLGELAERTGRSMSFLAQAALEEYLERESWQLERIREGIAAADAGDFATDEEVVAVFDRWAGR